MSLGKVLITGAGGLMGQYVANELEGRAELFGLDIVPAPREGQFTRYVTGSIEDFDTVREAVEGCDLVVQIAARPNIWSGSEHEIIRTNVTGTWNVLEAAEAAGVKRAVITSSDSTVGAAPSEKKTRTGASRPSANRINGAPA